MEGTVSVWSLLGVIAGKPVVMASQRPDLHSQDVTISRARYIITAMRGRNTERREGRLPADGNLLAE